MTTTTKITVAQLKPGDITRFGVIASVNVGPGGNVIQITTTSGKTSLLPTGKIVQVVARTSTRHCTTCDVDYQPRKDFRDVHIALGHTTDAI
jgi:hypothetical protein